jgi:hypothetical protein
MKALGYILAFFGVANLLRGYILLLQSSTKYAEQGVAIFLMGIVLIGASIFTFYQIKQRKKKKE